MRNENFIKWLLQYFPEREEADWLADHQDVVSATETPNLLGVSNRYTPYELYMRKLEGYPKIDNITLQRGRALEPILLGEYSRRNNVKVFSNGHRMFTHPIYTDSGGTPDAYAVCEDGIVVIEAKTASGYFGIKKFDEGIPEEYRLQMHKNGAIIQAVFRKYFKKPPKIKVQLVYLLDDTYQQIPIEEVDYESTSLLFAADKDFMDKVRNGEAPEPISFNDYKAQYREVINDKQTEINDNIISLFKRRNEIMAKLKQLQKVKKDLDTELEEIKIEVIKEIGDAESIVVPDDEEPIPVITHKYNAKGSRMLMFRETIFKKHFEGDDDAVI